MYQYDTAQYNFGEEDRETLIFSTDVHWHCESSKDPNIVVIRLLGDSANNSIYMYRYDIHINNI